MSARGFLGAGDLYIARQVAGVFQAFEGPFECTKFEIKPNVDLKELVSKGRTTYGQVIESVAVPKPATFTVELPEVNKTSLAIALLGTTAAATQASGSLAAEAINADLDFWVPLSKANLTGTVTVTNSGATTTYVEGTDYLVNRTLGWIKAITGGAITDAQPLKVSGAYGAISALDIAGMTNSQVRAKFRLDGKNFADDSSVIVDVYEGVIAADAAFDFLANDFNTVSMPGRMKTPSGFLAPFNVRIPA